jgi:hypothetical protein
MYEGEPMDDALLQDLHMLSASSTLAEMAVHAGSEWEDSMECALFDAEMDVLTTIPDELVQDIDGWFTAQKAADEHSILVQQRAQARAASVEVARKRTAAFVEQQATCELMFLAQQRADVRAASVEVARKRTAAFVEQQAAFEAEAERVLQAELAAARAAERARSVACAVELNRLHVQRVMCARSHMRMCTHAEGPTGSATTMQQAQR